MTWIEISIVSSAAAFIVLIVFAIRMLITIVQFLGKLGDTAAQAKISLAESAEQAEHLMKKVGLLTEEVHMQILALEPSIQSVEKAGAAIGDVASALRKASRMMNESIHGAEKVVHTHQKRIHDAMEWATTGLELWQRWKAHRNAKSDN
ncbi:DUF948 domain-containing protein [Paenibacillus alginolyticus]|uniref:DUF948 domain-containing protein n=1 Tax=Paenibacillus alginolyticus TaxID=59839 RepID=A0ABT4GKH1_9BACL|nr:MULTISPECIES: DUF948 domain-containing protein [Paenibacillus]MCY9667374.1 DUF948 domain-containing protein [Paenibacillus alginolyticus]MCY9696691.1 DUF948 domain-containing protein [Paenibacillus alginolyticus]MEC0144960.1 DUF948 domain-containing protein [Paenibacillus alginolyticus]NRF90699.1 DUF948 domain-containing protein [Paenibacillus frigoriresistens]